jgi:hypothetical protein
MPVYQRTVEQGITRETQMVIGTARSDAPRSAQQAESDKQALHAFFQQQHQLNSFDGRVDKVEQHCRQMLAEHARGGPALTEKDATPNGPAFGSQEWYAKQILMAIGAARSAQLRGHMSLAMSEAVEVGAWVTEAQAKFGPWANVLLGEARSRKNRELGRRGAASVRRKAETRDREILQAAAAYRRMFPDVSTEHSTRNMARHIAGDLAMKEGTVRDRLRKHEKR